MIFDGGKMRFQELRIVKESPINDILICSCPEEAESTQYTLLRVKQHRIAKSILRSFEDAGIAVEDICIDRFDYQGSLIFVFPCPQERPLSSFYRGESYSLTRCEDICKNLILACITSKLPPPILYLALKQGLVNIARDDSIYFSYLLDLEKLDDKKTERDCTSLCSNTVLSLLEPRADEKTVSYKLISKKAAKNSYNMFTELYKDVSIAAAPKGKIRIIEWIKAFFRRNKDRLFKILLVISIFLLFLALFSVISQLIFGEVIWLRLFINGFKVIGTERLDIR